ncbi:hypothetical protein [Rhizomonospora bruguierae]|uniref:hypothetical protein n=1 Tax=Rhizomonospora bruguierae TaxID=1581705 RepID=UPI001BD1A9DA|nr:hypothetical protein [Micromonospora sp. NBRC 107566]
MRVRPLRGLAACALALSVALLGAPAPARADDGTVSVQKVGDTVLRLLRLYSDGGLSPDEIAELVSQVIGAVRGAQSEVITHMDAIAAAPWLGAARHHILEFQDIEVFENPALWNWTQAVSGDADTAFSVFEAVSDRKTANNLGYAIHTLYPIALTARTKAGFGTTQMKENYRQALTAIVNKLMPVCTSSPGELDSHPLIYQVVHDCRTPDGRRVILQDYKVGGDWVEGPYTAESLLDEAGKNTSWAVAKAVLQTMAQ